MEHSAGDVRLLYAPTAREVGEALNVHFPEGRLFLIADRRVLRLHGAALIAAVRAHQRDVVVFSVAPGERSKSLRTAERLWRELLAAGISRKDGIVAFGGGVVGDLAGFVASTILRGVRWAQVPTSVLAMADASIGGKTGVNTSEGKNLVGSFHMPEVVVVSPLWLATLPVEETRSGLAEVVKTAWLEGRPAVDLLEDQLGYELLPTRLADLAWRAGCFKADIVARDFRESGLRVVLNFGHTFAHAIEAAAGFGQWKHGDAVAVGMVMVQELAAELGLAPAEVHSSIERTCALVGLPVDPPELGLDTWMRYLAQDKKKNDDGCRLVVLVSAGEYLTPSLPWGEIEAWLRARSD